MKNVKLITLLIVVGVLALIGGQTFYVVGETEQIQVAKPRTPFGD